MKISLIVGVRPEFIQCTQVVHELSAHYETHIIHTGQHYDYVMNQVFFDELHIPQPACHLDIGSGSHGRQTGQMLEKIESTLSETRPDMVIVFGDTNSTLAGALAAAKMQICVGHVESGMRSFDRTMPEEINRILTDHCSDILFCSTQSAVRNLRDEGIIEGVYLTGDVTVDALRRYKKIAEDKSTILERLDLSPKEYFVATIHRASNTDIKENIANIIEALCASDKKVVFPVHPRTQSVLVNFGLYEKLLNAKNIQVIQPLGYLDFLQLLNNAEKIITDSGGIQKEAYILQVPCITIRENTEWVETVEDGWNVLVGTDRDAISKMISEFSPQAGQTQIFGENASKQIVNRIKAIQAGRV
ncbi:MAG: UDP-N-acetylglucosamine 2-epimerase (non-hydrolyzing) [Clostridiaceae bacterium]|jgi:UDP-GlcNAc3NAcA epimerase|nr:UDP-N-acetylglucosamine 2-epimerase (non-hydrolyzing) [Clostridiaceae bacterium]